VPARAAAIAEYEELSALAREAGEGEVEPWDWHGLAEVVRRRRYDLDDAEVMPFLAVDNVLAAAFDCASRLFGIRFVERHGVPLYHDDVRLFEVRRGDDLAGLFLFDTYARPTKRSGAWMSSYRLRDDRKAGDLAVPVVANHNNFAKAPAGAATLLSLDDARTLFHEFGHGLHGLLSTSPYDTLAGTNVLRDFVELPSQLFEHWFAVPEVLRTHARHHETGAPMPDELIERVRRSAQFNQGFETVEYCASALVDLALHQLDDVADLDVDAFERSQLADLGMPPAMMPRHRLPHFLHLFAGSGYAAAYYVYLWAEVLDADAFDAFLETGDPFDPALADRLQTWIYASGDTVEPREAYRRFRGRDATVEPMLRDRGLLPTA
jgi:peptidyl-dipeptidase Dcp